MVYKVISKEEFDREGPRSQNYHSFATGGGYDFTAGLIVTGKNEVTLYWHSEIDDDYHRWDYARNAAFEHWGVNKRGVTEDIMKPTNELTAYAVWDLFCYVFDYELEAKVKLT